MPQPRQTSTSAWHYQPRPQPTSSCSCGGASYGADDFGSVMTDYLMFAAWPDTDSGTVKVSPRIAIGYEVSNEANVYKTPTITITPIASGTFINDTHVAATFVCNGCFVADSFQSTVTQGSPSATFSYACSLTAVSNTAVSNPADVNKLLSDHTLKGELYEPFDAALKRAESRDYETWVGLTAAAGTATASAGASGAIAGPVPVASSSAASSSSSSSSSPSSTAPLTAEAQGSLRPYAILSLVGLVIVHVLQAVETL